MELASKRSFVAGSKAGGAGLLLKSRGAKPVGLVLIRLVNISSWKEQFGHRHIHSRHVKVEQRGDVSVSQCCGKTLEPGKRRGTGSSSQLLGANGMDNFPAYSSVAQ